MIILTQVTGLITCRVRGIASGCLLLENKKKSSQEKSQHYISYILSPSEPGILERLQEEKKVHFLHHEWLWWLFLSC